jgi:ribose transport system substrate-binding protein
MRRLRQLAILGLLPCVLSACGGRDEGSATRYRLALVPKGATHEHWKSVHAGALKAVAELRERGIEVELFWNGPLREDDREQQIQVVEGFITRGVDGLGLAPLDSRALVRPVEEARRAGIAVLVFDSALEYPDIVSYVATDNYKGGRLAAARLGEVLGGRGRVLMLRYQEGSAATEEREAGFLDRMREQYPDVVVISSNQYAGATRDTARRASENLLNRHAHEIDGIFTPNESSTHGMLLALQDIRRAGRIAFVGFDTSSVFVEAMARKELHGFVVQNPVNMGYLSVMTLVDHLQGRPVPKTIDTGVELVTPENVDAPAIRKLLDRGQTP